LLLPALHTLGPSVPLRPTSPPITAIGLTMNPILSNYPHIPPSRRCHLACQLYFLQTGLIAQGKSLRTSPARKQFLRKGVVSQYFSKCDSGGDTSPIFPRGCLRAAR